MIDLTDCIAIGTIIKAHGIKGQVVLRLNHFESDDIHSLEPVFLEIDGLPVPFFVSEYYEKDPHTLLISFEDTSSNEVISELMNTRVFVPLKNIGANNSIHQNLNDLSGYEVRDSVHGKLGILTEIIPNEQNPLFRIIDKNREILLPAQPVFIGEIDSNKKIVHVKIPDGLLDI